MRGSPPPPTRPDQPAVSRNPLSPAIESLLQRFQALVRSVGGRHGLADAEVDELMQSVRLRVWHARDTSEQIAATSSSYVYRTAVSAALDIIRARRKREDPIDTIPERDEHRLGITPSPDQVMESKELEMTVSQAVEEITPSRRPVVKMFLAGYDREEIAQLLGWSEAKTRNLLYRGLADLRERLAERGIGPKAAR